MPTLTYQETVPGEVLLRLTEATASTEYDFERQQNASGYVLFARRTTDASGALSFKDISANRYQGSFLYRTRPTAGGGYINGESEIPEPPTNLAGRPAES